MRSARGWFHLRSFGSTSDRNDIFRWVWRQPEMQVHEVTHWCAALKHSLLRLASRTSGESFERVRPKRAQTIEHSSQSRDVPRKFPHLQIAGSALIDRAEPRAAATAWTSARSRLKIRRTSDS